MSRLLHAAARGARIQTYGSEYREYGDSHSWAEITRISLEEFDHNYYRIHPEDVHLQYGPVSTALREMAEDPALWTSKCWKWSIASSAANEFTIYFDSRTGEPDYPLFYLFLAEFLADEGI
jgi:hypothetical protein